MREPAWRWEAQAVPFTPLFIAGAHSALAAFSGKAQRSLNCLQGPGPNSLKGPRPQTFVGGTPLDKQMCFLRLPPTPTGRWALLSCPFEG